MKKTIKILFLILITGVILISPLSSERSIINNNAQAQAIPGIPGLPPLPDFFSLELTPPFGGKILVKDLNFCLKKVPPPIFVIVIPYYYIEVGPPNPAKLYYLFFISKQYREYRMEVSAWSLGKYFHAADNMWRDFCDINGSTMPEADGVIWPIGTSCLTDPSEGISCRKPPGESYDGDSIYEEERNDFDPLDFPDICDPLSSAGECSPPPPPE
ncbi:MAG: hypothetical protein A2826_00745 [Candidatus Doudnabacteria bacterium RIFCSPHIGHO2_01_FULL_43_23]|uniref:Uncharacterized protein n=1 Tax=Candidatus Doudnabacteria bacterium RIFCSPHIGHO2_01_FULL_43_23 TaxID=1817822 RepID=A0A1F5NU70_9BACT|nr:MAG: hypothetical protein A2826_00745 [Candidatus Doudnabacteria bacterium RIFCSPHIGHO2_01_FULL_43_23]